MSDIDSTRSDDSNDRPHSIKKRRTKYDSDSSTPRYSSSDEHPISYTLPHRAGDETRPSPYDRSNDNDDGRSLSPDGPLEVGYAAEDNKQSRIRRRHRSSKPRSESSFAGSVGATFRRASTPPRPLAVRYRLRSEIVAHEGAVAKVKFSPDGRWIASCSGDRTLKVWDSECGALMQIMEGHLAGISTLAWSPDSETIATGSDDKMIRLWDRASGKPYAVPFKGHHNYVYSMAFSPKGNMLVSGSHDEAVILWDVRAARMMRSLPAHSDPVAAVDFVRDGTLVVSCATDGLIRIWDSTTGQCLQTIVHEDNPPVSNVQFSPNGKYVLAWTLDGSMRLWDYVQGLCKKTYQGHVNKKYSIGGAFGSNGRDTMIVSGSEDGRIIFWDAQTKQILNSFVAHTGVTFWVDTHPYLNMVVSGGQDGLIKIWSDEDEDEEEAVGDFGELPERDEVREPKMDNDDNPMRNVTDEIGK